MTLKCFVINTKTKQPLVLNKNIKTNRKSSCKIKVKKTKQLP